MEDSGNGTSVSLWELYEGNVEGQLLYWGPWRISKRLWKQASLSIGSPMGNLLGEFIYWGLWETVKDCSVNGMPLYMGVLWGKPGGLLYSELCMLSKTCQGGLWKWRISFLIEAVWGGPGWRHLYWGLIEACNGRHWKWRISFIGLHNGNQGT